jgi:hypothetical protein
MAGVDMETSEWQSQKERASNDRQQSQNGLNFRAKKPREWLLPTLAKYCPARRPVLVKAKRQVR